MPEQREPDIKKIAKQVKQNQEAIYRLVANLQLTLGEKAINHILDGLHGENND